jgi:hypothetical protein
VVSARYATDQREAELPRQFKVPDRGGENLPDKPTSPSRSHRADGPFKPTAGVKKR